MSASTHRQSIRASSFLAVLLLTVLSCVDAPSAPSDDLSSGALVFAPQLSLVGPNGPALSQAQIDALDEAFDLVDRFRMLVRRASNNALVVDTVIRVTPGQEQYDLSAPVVLATAAEQFLVTLTALQGTRELFSSSAILVRATPGGASSAPPNVALTYTGPGATAASVEFDSRQLVLGPGGTATLAFKILAQDGSVIADVPVSWTSTANGVATVREGVVTSVSDGIAHIVAGLPTGLEARATVFVISGTLAYVQGGVVRTNAPSGGDAAYRGGDGGATAPAWSPDGARLFYAEGGSVRLAGDGSALFGGGWPSVSFDGTKLAADGGGRVVFANDDGSNATTGPSGTTPVWSGDTQLMVGGGSVQSVGVDGSGRVDVAGGAAELPARGPGGTVAYVDGGTLMVAGTGAVASGVGGRPSWSSDGLWLAVVSGGGIMIVPADGSAPPAALPGLEGASDPAFQPRGALSAPPAVSLTGFDPDPPIPGQPVRLLGGGFDQIIPANNRIFWPSDAGGTETAVERVSGSALSTTMPQTVISGPVRVETHVGSAVLDFIVALGAIDIHATTLDGIEVPGVGVTVVAADGSEAASGVTDVNGDFLASGLAPGSHVLSLAPPIGFKLLSAATQTFQVVAGGVVVVDAMLSPTVAAITISPADPQVAVGETLDISAQAFDVNGSPITVFDKSFWGGTTHVSAGGFGLSGVIAGVHPTQVAGGASFNVALNGTFFSFSATVTSFIQGTIKKTEDGETKPAISQTVSLESDGKQIATTSTDRAGRYRFDGLLAGSYTVKPIVGEGLAASPADKVVPLSQAAPTGQADFSIDEKGAAGSGDIVVVNDWNIWDTNANPPLLVQNLVATAPNAGTKVVWWCGRQANPFKICSSSIGPDGSGQFSGTRDAITAAGWNFEVDYQTPLVSIPSDVRVFWMWTPTEVLTDAEVNVLKAFAARGGRIVFNADFKESWYTSAQHANIETRLLSQLGTGITSTGVLSGSTGVIVAPTDPILAGVTSVSFGSPGDMLVSAPGVALVTDGSGKVLIARSSVDTTPIASALLRAAPNASAAQVAPAPAIQLPPNCVPGTVCGGASDSDSPEAAPDWPDDVPEVRSPWSTRESH